MPRGKELEQLPMANTLSGVGDDTRQQLGGIVSGVKPQPAKSTNEHKNRSHTAF